MSLPQAGPFFHFSWDELVPGPARDALERFFAKDTDDETRVRLARKILSLDVVIAHCMLFDVFQRMSMDSRWGVANPLEKVLDVLCVKALAIFEQPDEPQGNKHAAAAQILARTAQPKDIPLLLSRLDRPTHPELPMWLYWALGNAVDDLTSADMTLIEAMARRLLPGPEACFDRIEASRILEAHRVKPAEEALLGAIERLAPDEAIPVVSALLEHDPVRHIHLALHIRDALPEGYPREKDLRDGMGPPHHAFLEAIESAIHLQQHGEQPPGSRP